MNFLILGDPGYGPSRERKCEKLDKGLYTPFVKRVDAGIISNLSLGRLGNVSKVHGGL